MLDLSHDLHVILFGHLIAPRDSCCHHHLQIPKWRMGIGLKLGSGQESLPNFLFLWGPQIPLPCFLKGEHPEEQEEWEPYSREWKKFTPNFLFHWLTVESSEGG